MTAPIIIEMRDKDNLPLVSRYAFLGECTCACVLTSNHPLNRDYQ